MQHNKYGDVYIERCLQHTLWGNCWICLCYMGGTLETLENQTSIHLLKNTIFMGTSPPIKPLTKQWIRQPKKDTNPAGSGSFPVRWAQNFPSTPPPRSFLAAKAAGMEWTAIPKDRERKEPVQKLGRVKGVGRWMQRVVRLDKKNTFLGF